MKNTYWIASLKSSPSSMPKSFLQRAWNASSRSYSVGSASSGVAHWGQAETRSWSPRRRRTADEPPRRTSPTVSFTSSFGCGERTTSASFAPRGERGVRLPRGERAASCTAAGSWEGVIWPWRLITLMLLLRGT